VVDPSLKYKLKSGSRVNLWKLKIAISFERKALRMVETSLERESDRKFNYQINIFNRNCSALLIMERFFGSWRLFGAFWLTFLGW